MAGDFFREADFAARALGLAGAFLPASADVRFLGPAAALALSLAADPALAFGADLPLPAAPVLALEAVLAGDRAVDFLPAAALRALFPAADFFLAAVFLAAVFLVGAFFFGAFFDLAPALDFAAGFLAAAFLAAVFLPAADCFAGVFFAPGFFAVVLRLDGDLAVDFLRVALAMLFEVDLAAALTRDRVFSVGDAAMIRLWFLIDPPSRPRTPSAGEFEGRVSYQNPSGLTI